jgi:HPt (histidine-containing phosphotransfer) domain-containing protein
MGDSVLDLGVIDSLRDLGSMSTDGTERIRQLVLTFIDDAQVRTAGLARAAAEQDASELRALAHSLAGSSANLGARVVADICRTIEAAARADALSTAVADVARLQTALTAATAALRAALVDQPGDS